LSVLEPSAVILNLALEVGFFFIAEFWSEALFSSERRGLSTRFLWQPRLIATLTSIRSALVLIGLQNFERGNSTAPPRTLNAFASKRLLNPAWGRRITELAPSVLETKQPPRGFARRLNLYPGGADFSNSTPR
jgi:hypothetical protein